jgi:hypothetical protein
MAKLSKLKLLWASSMLCAGLAGCGSSSESFVFTDFNRNPIPAPAFQVTEPAPIERDGDLVDSIELEALDANGNPLAFPGIQAQGTSEPVRHVVVPFGQTMSFPPLPPGTESVELDYLRNGGFTLHRAVEDVLPGQTLLENPNEQPADVSSSKWQLKKSDTGAFTLDLIKTVAGVGTTESDFVIKGVCYSPTPINVLGDGAPNIGDFFFDPVKNPVTGNIDFFNWYGLWGTGSLGDGFNARDDLNKIRNLKANTIRTYSMLSRQQNEKDKGLPEFPDPAQQYHHQHEQFLDKCWNNGKDPIYVIVGIPLPPDNLYLDLQGNTDKIKFYDFVLRETIADLKDHPAVLGFTTQNEINNGPDAFPNGSGGQMTADNPSTGAVNDRSNFFWAKIKEHSDYAKATAPDKLNGICVHDFREIAQYASVFPNPGPTYLEQASNLDFIGINTYQAQNYDSQFKNGWGAVTGAGRKAIVFSELGFPATTRDENGDPKTLKETPASRQATADLVKVMLPKAYEDGVSLGACYFEFSDEWWKQVGNTKIVDGKTVRAVDEWVGGDPNNDFPNKYWDEEGFGLFSVARYPGLQNSDPVLVEVNGQAIGPDRRLDQVIERTEITKVIKEIFGSL